MIALSNKLKENDSRQAEAPTFVSARELLPDFSPYAQRGVDPNTELRLFLRNAVVRFGLPEEGRGNVIDCLPKKVSLGEDVLSTGTVKRSAVPIQLVEAWNVIASAVRVEDSTSILPSEFKVISEEHRKELSYSLRKISQALSQMCPLSEDASNCSSELKKLYTHRLEHYQGNQEAQDYYSGLLRQIVVAEQFGREKTLLSELELTRIATDLVEARLEKHLEQLRKNNLCSIDLNSLTKPSETLIGRFNLTWVRSKERGRWEPAMKIDSIRAGRNLFQQSSHYFKEVSKLLDKRDKPDNLRDTFFEELRDLRVQSEELRRGDPSTTMIKCNDAVHRAKQEGALRSFLAEAAKVNS